MTAAPHPFLKASRLKAQTIRAEAVPFQTALPRACERWPVRLQA
jgi:hypothetical protein